jgi:DNA-binding IscR family transcriptional regulator
MNDIQRVQLLASAEIFSDPNVNARFYTAIELLAQVVMVMPRTASLASLVQATGKTPRLIRSILATLGKDGLVAKDSKEKDAWHCRNCNGIITLADVYRCFSKVEEQKAKKEAPEAVSGSETGASKRSSSQQSVDVLMMQVKMTVNRAVLQQLEQFDLSRLRGLSSATSFRSHNARPRGYIPEPY